MHSIYFHKFFIFSALIVFSGYWCKAQDSELLSQRDNWKVGFNSSIGIANGRNLAGKWYNSSLSGGTSITFSRRVAGNFWISSGYSFDYTSYRSDPFVHSGSTYHFYGINPQGQGVGWTTYYTDDFERYTIRKTYYLSIPLQCEFSSPQQKGFYSRGGVSYGGSVKDFEINRRIPDNVRISRDKPVQVIGTPYNDGSLFLNLAGGFQYRKNRNLYQLGVRYDHVLASFDYYQKERGVHSLRLEIGMQHAISGSRYRNIASKTYAGRLDRKNYLYVELLGNTMLYSLNYERSFIVHENYRINGRVGGALRPSAYSGRWSRMAIFGGSYNYGKVHSLELGLNGAYLAEPFYDGSVFEEMILIPTLGYRFEPESGFFFRASFTPQLFLEAPSYNGQVFLGVFGLSFGAHF